MPKRSIPKVNKPATSSKPVNVINESENETQAGVKLDDAAAQQIELELCWCIQQLQTALTDTNSKMNPRQSTDALRSLNILKNNNVSLVKKRQVMRSTFGDYRAKMAEEEKRFRKANARCIIQEATPSKNSRFLKRSAIASAGILANKLESTENSFRFNFNLTETAEEATIEKLTTQQENCSISK